MAFPFFLVVVYLNIVLKTLSKFSIVYFHCNCFRGLLADGVAVPVYHRPSVWEGIKPTGWGARSAPQSDTALFGLEIN